MIYLQKTAITGTEKRTIFAQLRLTFIHFTLYVDQFFFLIRKMQISVTENWSVL